MDTSEKVYNLNLLGNTSSIDIKEGVKQCGSLRGYFKELHNFADTIHDTLDGLLPDKPKKDQIARLNSLYNRLLSIGETDLAPMVGSAILRINQSGDKEAIAEELQMVKNRAFRLCQRIQESERTFQNADEVQDKDSQEEPAPSDECNPAVVQRTKTIPRAVFFENLKSYIEKFDFDAATDELNSLSGFTYSDEIDNRLDKIVKHLNNFDFDEATNEINVIMKIVSVTESSIKTHLKKKILAIDDVPDVLSTLKSILKNDYNVYCVTNHIAALKFLVNNTPDLILLDIEMPDMDGFTLLKIIRQMESCKTIPVIFLTGNANAENIKNSVESGGNDFMKKPVEYKILMNKIKKHLNK